MNRIPGVSTVTGAETGRSSPAKGYSVGLSALLTHALDLIEGQTGTFMATEATGIISRSRAGNEELFSALFASTFNMVAC